jgi:hypothetical protein
MLENASLVARPPYRPIRIVRCLTAGFALAAALGFARASAAAEIGLSGTGTFKTPAAEQLARLPADAPFSRADLESGRWSFSVRYADQTTDADPDPYLGRYVGAIQEFRITIGGSTITFAPDQVELSVSDGGSAQRNREAIRIEGRSVDSADVVRAGWVQVNQRPTSEDLRGAAGVLASDAMPAPAQLARLATSSAFDRFFYVRIDGPGATAQPLLFLSASTISVAVDQPTAAR